MTKLQRGERVEKRLLVNQEKACKLWKKGAHELLDAVIALVGWGGTSLQVGPDGGVQFQIWITDSRVHSLHIWILMIWSLPRAELFRPPCFRYFLRIHPGIRYALPRWSRRRKPQYFEQIPSPIPACQRMCMFRMDEVMICMVLCMSRCHSTGAPALIAVSTVSRRRSLGTHNRSTFPGSYGEGLRIVRSEIQPPYSRLKVNNIALLGLSPCPRSQGNYYRLLMTAFTFT